MTAFETCYRQASQRDGPDYQRHPEDQEGRCSINTHSCQVVLIFLQHFQLDVDICLKKNTIGDGGSTAL